MPQPPICHTLGFRLATVSKGNALFTMTPAFRHYNPIGTGAWRGGFDAARQLHELCPQTNLDAGLGYITLELKVNLVRSTTRDDRTDPRGRPHAPCRTVREPRGGKILDANGTL
jgi:acyl-coenzyme A thioesterase PaaI-like protein